MKFMKLGSKPDSFQSDGKNDRYVASELASDITIDVGDVKFYLHKFPLLSKSALLQKLAAPASGEQSDVVDISDIPGGADAFEVCAKFCYGMTVTLNAHNVIIARCAAEFLEMHEGVEKGNLVYKIDVFLGSSIFRSWKDSIIVLQTTTSLSSILPEEQKLAGRCVEAIAAKACIDVSKVDWSYTYNRKKLQDDMATDQSYNGVVKRSVPGDWWVEDLCELEIDLYRRVLASVKSKERVSGEVIGEALKAYAYRRLPGFAKGAVSVKSSDAEKLRTVVDSIAWLLPAEKGSVSCSFLLRLLKAASVVGSGEAVKEELVGRIGQQLEAASVSDILIRTASAEDEDSEETTMYDVGIVKRIVEEFLRQGENQSAEIEDGIRKIRPGILSDASKLMVAKLIDGYLAEIAKDPKLPLSTFADLAEMVSGISRPAHDGIYRAIDMYLKEHPGITKGERKRICKLMDCRKLSVDACMHAVQNERLPMRVVVQVLFFEQVRAAASSGSSTPDLPKSIKDLNSASHGSSRSANTNTEEDWDALATAEELRALRGELAALRLSNGSAAGEPAGGRTGADKAAITKMRGLLKSKKIFTRLWSGKSGQPENSGSDSSESLGSAVAEEAKSTPSRNRRHSVS